MWLAVSKHLFLIRPNKEKEPCNSYIQMQQLAVTASAEYATHQESPPLGSCDNSPSSPRAGVFNGRKGSNAPQSSPLYSRLHRPSSMSPTRRISRPRPSVGIPSSPLAAPHPFLTVGSLLQSKKSVQLSPRQDRKPSPPTPDGVRKIPIM